MSFPAIRTFGRWFGEHSPLPASLRMVREHSAWLTRMLTGGGNGGRETKSLPRIPVRKVSEGGFSRMMSTSAGRYRAERWWERTLERMQD